MQAPPVALPPISRTITLAEGMTVKDLSEKLEVRVKDVLKVMLERRMMMNINSAVDIETARDVARTFGAEVETRSFEEELQRRGRPRAWTTRIWSPAPRSSP